MDQDQNSLFNFVQSLPALGHSEAIITRHFATNHRQPLEFIPDYGGVVEVPKINLKHYSLDQSLPFDPSSSVHHVPTACSINDPTLKFISQDCLFVKSNQESDDGIQLATIQAVGKSIHFNLIQETGQRNGVYNVSHQHDIAYPQLISGIKYRSNIPDMLLVKFSNGVKIIKLDDLDSGDKGTPVASLLCKKAVRPQDASMNFATKSLLAIASENNCVCQVRLYDLAQSDYSKQACHTITWPSYRNEPTVICDRVGFVKDRLVRGNILKTHIPGGLNSELRQLDNIPSHIANLLVTSITKTMLIDPRMDQLGQVYVDKIKIPTFHPIEYIKKTDFSNRNSYQFYCLTNLNLRVFDTRYPNMPLNQISHMLGSTGNDPMNMRVLDDGNSTNETLCLTLRNRLCFLTFDQAQKSDIINPKSLHMPYHDTHLGERTENWSGLAIVPYENLKRDVLFSVLQTNNRGDICMKNYSRAKGSHLMDFEVSQSQKSCKSQVYSTSRQSSDGSRSPNSHLKDIAFTKFRVKDNSRENIFDMLEQEVDYQGGITSSKASERSKKFRNILNKDGG